MNAQTNKQTNKQIYEQTPQQINEQTNAIKQINTYNQTYPHNELVSEQVQPKQTLKAIHIWFFQDCWTDG